MIYQPAAAEVEPTSQDQGTATPAPRRAGTACRLPERHGGIRWHDGGQGEKRCQSPFFAADGGIQAGVRRWLSPGLQRNCGRLQLREADRPRLGGLGASEAVFSALPDHQCEDGAAVRQYRRTLVYVLPMFYSRSRLMSQEMSQPRLKMGLRISYSRHDRLVCLETYIQRRLRPPCSEDIEAVILNDMPSQWS